MAGRKPLCDDEILRAVEQHWRDFLYPPTIQYLVDNSCVQSKNTVWLALKRMAKQKKIYLILTIDGNKAYTLWARRALVARLNQLEEL